MRESHLRNGQTLVESKWCDRICARNKRFLRNFQKWLQPAAPPLLSLANNLLLVTRSSCPINLTAHTAYFYSIKLLRYCGSEVLVCSLNVTAIRSCSRYCSNVFPPRSILRVSKKFRTSRSSSGVASPTIPLHMRRNPCFGKSRSI